MRVWGTVQGVGFRPWVHRLAASAQLTGTVRNDGLGALIEVQGSVAALKGWHRRLTHEAPANARIEGVEVEAIEVDAAGIGPTGFAIVASDPSAGRRLSLAPDAWTCGPCLAEVADVLKRRHRYPFTNCTACGPRYTITRSLPYDRPATTMAKFEMCPACRAEYTDLSDRRYHAQPIACPTCGPTAWLERVDQPPLLSSLADPAVAIDAAAAMLRSGSVLAIKGVGGFHLACDASNELAVADLRVRKSRARKPLAIMVRDLSVARSVARLDPAQCDLLSGPAAPILLAPQRLDSLLCPALAPGLNDVGLMLPYSPLHHLLMAAGPPALVMTSGNPPSEPICTENTDARQRLPADGWLMHDRPIEVACDDSVLRTHPLGPVFIRRGRGYVPGNLPADFLPPCNALGLGAELKSTVATLVDGVLTVGRHLGDLDNPRAETAFAAEVARMLTFARVAPERLACDLHPSLFTTLWAEDHYAHLPLIRVQHHHAHMAATRVEHGVAPDTLTTAIVLDGVGFGGDGTAWGGEVLVGDYAGFERSARLRPVPQPGGDRAAREPLRMAISLLWDGGHDSGLVSCPDAAALTSICDKRAFSPLTSSTGRLFDGVAALLGVATAVQQDEGEAAMRLEAVADAGCADAYDLPLRAGQLDTRALVAALLVDGASVPLRAARFHNGLADGLARAAIAAGHETVVLGGGCMINRLLLGRLVSQLRRAGLQVLWPRLLPPGDGAIAAGQLAVAACQAAPAGGP